MFYFAILNQLLLIFYFYRVLKLKRAHLLGARPSYEEVDEVFRRTRYVAVVVGVFCILVILVVIPLSITSQGVLTTSQLSAWVSTCRAAAVYRPVSVI